MCSAFIQARLAGRSEGAFGREKGGNNPLVCFFYNKCLLFLFREGKDASFSKKTAANGYFYGSVQRWGMCGDV